jgi:hypothetical protein
MLNINSMIVKRLVVAAGAAAVWVAGSTFAQIDEAGVPIPRERLAEWISKPESRNAALRYWALASSISREQGNIIAEVNWDAVGGELDRSKWPKELEAAAKLVEGELGMISPGLASASKLAKCDFEIPLEEGVSAILPHLGRMRMIARVVRIDARVHLAAGRADKAAESLSGLFRLSRHLPNDRILISSLVGVAISALARNEMQYVLASPNLTDVGRNMLLAELKESTKHDPFQFRNAVEAERVILLEWIRAQANSGPRGMELVASLAEPSEQTESSKLIRALDAKSIAEACDMAEKAYDEVLAALDHQDPTAEIVAITDRVVRGDYGPVAQLFFPSFTKAHENITKETHLLGEMLEKARSKPAPSN